MADITQSNHNATDASNTTAPPDGMPEGQNPSTVNDWARAFIGAVKRWYNWTIPATTAGTTTAYTLTYTPAPGALADGMPHRVLFNATCGASPTLNVNSLGARAIHKYSGGAWVAVAAGDLVANSVHLLAYNSADTSYRIIGSSMDPFLHLSNILTTRGDMIRRGATIPERVALGASGKVMASDGTDPAWAWVIRGVPQTVQGGPVTTAGLPDFLPATDADLNLVSQNISSTYPLVAVAANGFADGGMVGRTGASTANLTWSSLTASRAAATPNFLYVTVNDDGTLTTGFTLVSPVYQRGGTPATTSGLFTFNISEMKGYLGNGSTAPQTNLVMVGEAATDGTGVISTVAYAYNGRYDSGYTATLWAANTPTARNHNLGVTPQTIDARIQCTTAEVGYAVGDEIGIGAWYHDDGPVAWAAPLTASRLSAVVAVSLLICGTNKLTTARVNFTAARWKWRIVADRGW